MERRWRRPGVFLRRCGRRSAHRNLYLCKMGSAGLGVAPV